MNDCTNCGKDVPTRLCCNICGRPVANPSYSTPPEANADMQSIMSGNGHPDEAPCVVCGAVFDTHAEGCIFDTEEAHAEAGMLSTHLGLLRVAIIAGDPKKELLLRIDDMEKLPESTSPAPAEGLLREMTQRVLAFVRRWVDTDAEEVIEHIYGPDEPADLDTFVAKYAKELRELRASLTTPTTQGSPGVLGDDRDHAEYNAKRACELLIEYEDSMDGAEQGDGKEAKYWQAVIFARHALQSPEPQSGEVKGDHDVTG